MIGTLKITYVDKHYGNLRKIDAARHKKYVNTLSLGRDLLRGINSKNTLLSNRDSAYYIDNAIRTYRDAYLNRRITKTYTLSFEFAGKKYNVSGTTLSFVKEERRNIIRQVRVQRRTPVSRSPERYTRTYQYVRPPLVGGVHLTPGYFLNLRRARLSKMVFEPKRPSTSEHHVGIELEFTANADRTTLGVSLFEAGLATYVTLKGDASIQVEKPRHHSHELAICVPQSKLEEVISLVTKTLAKHEATVNKSTGMHTHIDVRNRDRRKVFSRLVSAQTILFAMQPKSRRNNNYCKRTKSRDLYTAASAGRYQGVNPEAANKYNTIEVRLHSGTVSFDKIVNWVKLLLVIVDGAYVDPVRAPRTVETFCNTFGIGADLKAYIETRVAKFKSAGPVEDEAV